MIYETHSADETKALAQMLASSLNAGDVLLLNGDMGAGKSEFARGIARGLNIVEPVTSPSFTLLQVYESGRIPLYHFDWYRINSADEIYELSMDEYIGGDGLTLIEWPSLAEELIPDCHLQISIQSIGDEDRRITLTPAGNFHSIPTFHLREGGENS